MARLAPIGMLQVKTRSLAFGKEKGRVESGERTGKTIVY